MRIRAGVIGAIVALPLAAFAQTRVEVEIEEPVVSVEASGGVFDYLDNRLDSATARGGAWGVRATALPAKPVSIEVAYVGTVNEIEGAGIAESADAQLLGNGGEILARANVLEFVDIEQLKDFRVEPYVAAGAGYSNLTLAGDDRNAIEVQQTFNRNANVFSIPAAVGVQAHVRDRFTVGARAGYNYQFANDIRRGETDDSQNWSASANVGMAF